jgi:hypothetical protein
MLYDVLLVATVFVTRIVLPVLVTVCLGSLIERALNHDAYSAA